MQLDLFSWHYRSFQVPKCTGDWCVFWHSGIPMCQWKWISCHSCFVEDAFFSAIHSTERVSHSHWLKKSFIKWKHIFLDIYWLCIQEDPISSPRGKCCSEKSQDDALQLSLVLGTPMISISFLRYFQLKRDKLAQAVAWNSSFFIQKYLFKLTHFLLF